MFRKARSLSGTAKQGPQKIHRRRGVGQGRNAHLVQGRQQQADCDSTAFLHVVVRVAVTGFWRLTS